MTLYLYLISTAYVGISLGFMLFKHATMLIETKKRMQEERIDYEPTIAIIVPCYNENEDDLTKCLYSCLINNYEKKVVYAINDGSTNNTKQVLKKIYKIHPELIVINSRKNQGKKEAMYKAIKKTKEQIIVCVDSDTIVHNGDSIRELVKPFNNTKVNAVSGNTRATNHKTNWLTKMQAGRYALAYDLEKSGQSLYGSVTCCPGCYSAYRRISVNKVLSKWRKQTVLGVNTSYGDDRSLTRLILVTGGEVAYAPNAVAYTNVPEQITSFVKQQVRWKRSFFTEHYFLAADINKIRYMARVELVWFTFVWFFGLLAKAILIYSLYAGFITLSQTLLLYASFSLVHYAYVIIRYPGVLGLWGAAYTFLNDITIEWLTLYSLFTLKETRWGTR